MCEAVQVGCYSGHTYAQEPRTITKDGRHYRIRRVLRRWREPGGPCFAVVMEGEEERVVCYHGKSERWCERPAILTNNWLRAKERASSKTLSKEAQR
jgi:hypothetical protein